MYNYEDFKHLFKFHKKVNEYETEYIDKNNILITVQKRNNGEIKDVWFSSLLPFKYNPKNLLWVGNKDYFIWVLYSIHINTFKEIILKENYIAKTFITFLAKNNISFKVIQLGAGVKKIIKKDNVCPHCIGLGYLNPKNIEYTYEYFKKNFKFYEKNEYGDNRYIDNNKFILEQDEDDYSFEYPFNFNDIFYIDLNYDGVKYSCRNKNDDKWMLYSIFNNSFVSTIEIENKIAQRIIVHLAENNISFKVVQLGGGVKKIINKENLCQYCNGFGLVSPEKIINYPHQQYGVDSK